MPIAKFSVVALDCPDPMELALFYQGIVGGEVATEPDDDEWVELEIPDASPIAFQRVARYVAPQWPDGEPQQAHLDFAVDDLNDGETAVLALGARKTTYQPAPDRWRVFLDPVGHPFCLVKA